ncbi:MAG TPA: hypothetical protein ENI65_10330 [Gammaproteobacteria bacterium]|nr:hypothetical protein [Gammaproteobacteria bacterium]
MRTWNRTSRIKTVCRTDAAVEPPWMACFACLDSASPVSCPDCGLARNALAAYISTVFVTY